MLDWNAMSDDEFRRHMAGFIEKNLPAELRGQSGRPPWKKSKPWFLALSNAGMIAPAWPVEHGGMALSPSKHIIYLEEIDRAGCPRMNEHGTMTVGPALIIHGTPEQQKKYLPRILSGEDVWCQGFSEPNAGSDLASLRTEARVEGDELVINGQKIWTSGAHDANKLFALVRTNKQVKKQAGISFVLMDREQPGITIRTIRMIDGSAHFNETFFDNARAKLEDVVGGLDNGWKVANSLLGSERLWAGSPRHAMKYLAVLERVARAAGRNDDPVYVDRHAQLLLDAQDLASTYLRTVSMIGAGKSYGFEASILKIWQTELSQRIMNLALEIAGEAGALSGKVDLGVQHMDLLYPYIESRPPTIYGGTVQIHRNILAKNVLRLPS
jgi:alkylation response protein AidB-like acyl-CoA dehydrogenase